MKGGRGALLPLPLLIYLALPTRNFYWDGVAFAINIEKQLPPSGLLHPSHLIYALAGAWLYKALASIGIHARALFMLQVVNSILAWASVVIIYTVVRRKSSSSDDGITVALLLAFSATWWKFATDANAYIPAIFLILCSYYAIETSGSVVAAGFLLAGAMLFHELAILFLPVALLRLKQTARSLLFLTCSLVPVGIAYVLAYRTVSGALATSGFLTWLTFHSPDSGFSFNPLRSAVLTLRGTLRLFLGGRVGDVVPGPLSVAGLLALGAVTIALLARSSRALRVALTLPRWHLVVWIGIYLAFLFFWMPQNTFYRLFYLPALVLLVHSAGAMSSRKGGLWLVASFPMLWNLVLFIYPQSRVERNAPLNFALQQHQRWPAGTPILYHRFHPDLWTISYFNQQAAWVGIDRVDPGQLDRTLEYARKQGEPLWIEATAYDLIAADPVGQKWLAAHPSTEAPPIRKDSKSEFRFHPLR